MSIAQPYPLRPGAKLDFAFDWTDWLPAGDSLASYTVAAGPGLTMTADSRAGAVVTAWLEWSAPAPGPAARSWLDCDVVTAAGRSDVRRIEIAAG